MKDFLTAEDIEQIRSLLKFKPKLLKTNPVRKGESQTEGTVQVSYPEYDEMVIEFFSVIQGEYWRVKNYSHKWEHLIGNEAKIKNLSFGQLKDLLTYCARGERFCEGFWETILKSGTINMILERLEDLTLNRI